MTPPPTDTDTSTRAQRFVRRLAAAHKSRSPQLSAARRWTPGRVDPHIAALTFTDTDPATDEEYPVWAQTAKLYTVWHSGRLDHANGYPGAGIGRWAHQLGVGDPAAQRCITRICTATNAAQLDTALAALASARTARPPHWPTVIDELSAWNTPDTRDATRLTWARDFYRFPPKP